MRKTKTRNNLKFLKNLLYCIVLISLLLAGYIGFDQIRPSANPENSMPLSEFMIGVWVPIKHLPQEIREIQFVSGNKAWYDVLNTNDGYQEEATYQFISNDIIQIQGRRDATIAEWKLSRTGVNLEICFQINCVVYARERIKWWWILITLTVAILAFYVSKKLDYER